MKLKEDLLSPKGLLIASVGQEVQIIEEGEGGFCLVELVGTGNKTIVHKNKLKDNEDK